MKKTIRTGIEKPMEYSKGTITEKPIEYGVRQVCSSFDRRPDEGGITCVGPSKLEGRNSMPKGATGQKKKHVSTGKGQHGGSTSTPKPSKIKASGGRVAKGQTKKQGTGRGQY